jgi:MATE family multidrug resistance protein
MIIIIHPVARLLNLAKELRRRYAQPLQSIWSETGKLSRIAGPLILSSLVSMGVSIIDVAMMSTMGPKALAAGAIVSDYYSVFYYFFGGIIAASATLIARALGAGDRAGIRRLTHCGFILVILLGITGLAIMRNTAPGLDLVGIKDELIMIGKPYGQMMGYTFVVMTGVNFLYFFLSAHGNSRAILFASIVGLPVNALGNYGLMFGHFGLPELGLAGAGLSSMFAALVMLVFMFVAMARKHYFSKYKLLRFTRIHLPSMGEFLKIGFPIAISNLGEMGVFMISTVMMGKFGAQAVAAHVIALRLAGVLYALPMGYAQAATIRIGFAIGARQKGKLLDIMKATIAISLTTGFLFLIMIAVFRFEISSLFISSDQAARDIVFQASLFLLLLAISQPLECLGAMGNGILRGFKDTRRPMVLSTIAFWGVGFIGGNILAFYYQLGATGLWAGLAAGSICFGFLIGTRLLFKWRQFGLEVLPS